MSGDTIRLPGLAAPGLMLLVGGIAGIALNGQLASRRHETEGALAWPSTMQFLWMSCILLLTPGDISDTGPMWIIDDNPLLSVYTEDRVHQLAGAGPCMQGLEALSVRREKEWVLVLVLARVQWRSQGHGVCSVQHTQRVEVGALMGRGPVGCAEAGGCWSGGFQGCIYAGACAAAEGESVEEARAEVGAEEGAVATGRALLDKSTKRRRTTASLTGLGSALAAGVFGGAPRVLLRVPGAT